jgi:hypothetical protein
MISPRREAMKEFSYEAPEISDRGDLTELTALQATGASTDAAFPPGTPKGDITFSNP